MMGYVDPPPILDIFVYIFSSGSSIIPLSALVRAMLVADPAQRCSLEDVLTSAWLNSPSVSSRAELSAAIKANSVEAPVLTSVVPAAGQDLPREIRQGDFDRQRQFFLMHQNMEVSKNHCLLSS